MGDWKKHIPEKFQFDDSLSIKATKGIFWMALRQGVLQVLLLVKLLLVANLLGPEIFGIFGFVFLIVVLFNQFSQFGIEFALIHKQKRHEYYDTAWTIGLIRGIFLFSILLIFMDTIYTTFSLETSKFVFVAITSTLVLEGFVNIGTIDFPKELQFRKEFIFRAIPDSANVFASILLTFLINSIWALVLGLLLERIFRLILSYRLHDYRPHLSLNKSQTVELFQFGKWIFIMGILGFLVIQGPDLVIGIALSVTLLAIYQVGYKLATLPVSSLSVLVATVSLPTYAKLQEDQESSVRTYKITLLGQITFFSLYVSIIYPITRQFVIIILGNSWIQVIDIFGILLLVSFISIFITSIEPLFIANGLQKVLLKWQAIGIFTFLLLVYTMLDHYDIFDLIVFFALSLTITMIGYIYELTKLLNFDYKHIFSSVTQIISIGIANLIILTGLQDTLTIENVFGIALYVLSGVVTFLLVMTFLVKAVNFDFIKDFEFIIR